MLELIKAGGWAMWPIFICSALVLAISLERFWTLRHAIVVPPNLGDEVRGWAQQRVLDPQHLATLETNSPLGRVFAAGLRVRRLGTDAVRERIEDAGRHVMHDLEKYLNTLGTIALISPLLGLLGTVYGMIRMFLAVLSHGTGDAQQLAGGIGEALVCTAAGLMVAIPAYVLHRFLRGKVTELGIAIEREVMRLMDDLELSGTTEAGLAIPVRRSTR